MKIIDNKKDYYDYLVGYYGLDPYVVYDRRNSVVVKNKESLDILSDTKTTFENEGENIYICALCAGKNINVSFLYRFVSKSKVIKIYLESYEDFIKHNEHSEVIFQHIRDTVLDSISEKDPLILYISPRNQFFYWRPNMTAKIIKNPILKDTLFTSIMSANRVWEGIYNYLLSCKEPKIIDTRTDVQHLESAGFDKKTSFRNIK